MFMQKVSLLSLALASFATAQADESRTGDLVRIDATAVFVPVGFDDNDEAEVVVDGFLPSGCYRQAKPELAIDHVARTIEITPMARRFAAPCVEVLVPYFFEVKLGQLEPGSYAVEVRGATTSLTESLPVKHAIGTTPDDFDYLPVDDVRVDRNAETGGLEAVIYGRFTNRCMSWGRALVEDNGKTLNILPIMAFDTTPGANCRTVEMRYKQTIALPATVSAGRHLLHVRSLNGDAMNRLFEK